MTYQKCIEDICFAKAFKTHEDVVIVKFTKTRSTPRFEYCPMYEELRKIILLLIEKYGAKEVFKELKIGVMIEK